VLSHSETKGIGTKVVENADYLALYAGVSGTDVLVDGVSGATLSSNGVRALVLAANTAVLEVIGA
jgi:Na+-transporting NADH:ubiquinone oxidoreductase subunit NqrC